MSYCGVPLRLGKGAGVTQSPGANANAISSITICSVTAGWNCLAISSISNMCEGITGELELVE